MKLTFVSCYLNHHQLPLCLELERLCDEFHFIVTEKTPEFRSELGYEDLNDKYDFVVRTYDSGFDNSRLRQLLSEADAVIFGSCPDSFIEYRMKQHKLSFLYSERFLKKGVYRRFIPRTHKKIESRLLKFSGEELYVLCASAFLPWELKLCGFDTDKCFRWGYFVQLKEYADVLESKTDRVPRILWAGRMISWKRAADAVSVCAALMKKGYDFTLEFIGGGECEDKLKSQVKRLELQDRVRFLGAMPPQKVRLEMERSDIFLMTSSFREGWGAVVNEAMNSGCAVVASSAVGSVPYLINDGENGLIYRFGSKASFERKLESLLADRKYIGKLGAAAYETVADGYSASAAAQRLTDFIKTENKKEFFVSGGAMSRPEIIKDNWYKE